MAELDRISEAQEAGERFRNQIRLPFAPGTPEGIVLDRAAGATSALGRGAYGLVADLAGGTAAALGLPSLAADLEQKSDRNYNIALDQFQGGYSAGANRPAAEFDVEPADFFPGATATAPRESPRPQARPAITPDMVREMLGSTPLSMGQPVTQAARPQAARPQSVITSGALRRGGPGVQQALAGSQAQELERLRQTAPGSPPSGTDMLAQLRAQAAQEILSNQLAAAEEAGTLTPDLLTKLYRGFLGDIGNEELFLRTLMDNK